ncbi:hypothetical protein [Oleiagrimonas sp. C23AA]|nr:hypothetical protein [Oleiagrimonas sp. C23AA]
MAFADHVKPVHAFVIGGESISVYTGLFALAVNIIVAIIVQLFAGNRGVAPNAEQA